MLEAIGFIISLAITLFILVTPALLFICSKQQKYRNIGAGCLCIILSFPVVTFLLLFPTFGIALFLCLFILPICLGFLCKRNPEGLIARFFFGDNSKDFLQSENLVVICVSLLFVGLCCLIVFVVASWVLYSHGPETILNRIRNTVIQAVALLIVLYLLNKANPTTPWLVRCVSFLKHKVEKRLFGEAQEEQNLQEECDEKRVIDSINESHK